MLLSVFLVTALYVHLMLICESRVEEEIQAHLDAWSDTFNNDKWQEWSELYTEDCSFMVAGSETLNGRSEVFEFGKKSKEIWGFYRIDDYYFKEIIDIGKSPQGFDQLLMRGGYKFYDKDDKLAHVGKDFLYFIKENNEKWRVKLDMFNSDGLPALNAVKSEL